MHQIQEERLKYLMDEKLGEIVWMRRKFKYACKKGWEIAVKLTIPAGTKQRCLFYINGKAVGQYEEAGPQTEFYVPSSFLKKENMLAVILEGPKAALVEPALDTFYEVKDVDVQITMG